MEFGDKSKQSPLRHLSEESASTPRIWAYDQLREYALAYGQMNSQVLLTAAQMPDILSFSQSWRSHFKNMKELTNNGFEYFSYILFKSIPRGLYLQEPIKGNQNSVTAEIRNELLKRARDAGFNTILGDIHSHPNPSFLNDLLRLSKDSFNQVKRLGKDRPFSDTLIKKFDEFKRGIFNKARILGIDRSLEQIYSTLSFLNILTDQSTCQFSASDLYGFVIKGGRGLMRVVVEGDEVLCAFQTKGTEDTRIDPLFMDREAFITFWLEKYGFRYLGDDPQGGGVWIEGVRPNASQWVMNAGITQKHKLVLYGGKINEDLIRMR